MRRMRPQRQARHGRDGVRAGARLARWAASVLALAIFGGVFGCLSGCAARPAGLEAYMRDGQQYGVTEGRFRGRWWNFYERGRSFGAGGFWEEAEEDLRVALALRGTDARWARTYGLRFLPEYFPNREVGIALYHQGQINEAIDKLEASLAQTHSARAAYYLGLALREKLVDEGTDHAPPSFELLQPSPRRPAASFAVELHGVARDDQYVGRVWINDVPIPFDRPAPEVEVRHTVSLTPDDNLVTVAVEDLTGKRWEGKLAVPFDLDGPAVSFDHPVPQRGLVRGVAHHPSGIAAMFVGGVQACLRPLGERGASAFEARLAQPLDTPIPFVCVDALGNMTRGEVPFDVVPEEQFARVERRNLPMLAMSGAETPGRDTRSALRGVLAGVGPLAQASGEGYAAPAALYVRVLGIQDGAVFQQDELVVNMEIASAAPLAEVTLNGWPVRFSPGRERQTVSRRVPLVGMEPMAAQPADDGPMPVQLVARVRDTADNEAETVLDVYHEKLSDQFRHDRLRVALMGMAPGPYTRAAPMIAELAGERLADHIAADTRFVPLGRDLRMMEGLSREAEIRALVPEFYRNTAELRPAELLLWGRIAADPGTLELQLSAVASEMYAGHDDYSLLVARADVCGPYDPAGPPEEQQRQLDDLTHMLYLRFRQEFPLVRGPLWSVPRPDRFAAFLDSPQVREGYKVVLYRVDTAEREVLGRLRQVQTHIMLGEGLIQDMRGDLAEGILVALDQNHAAVYEKLVGREHVVDEEIWVSTK